jgi:hypothetical protein
MALKGDLDITKNLKMVEWLKAELVQSVGALFKSLLNASAEATADKLAAIIILIYLLGCRVGVSFAALDRAVKLKLEQSLAAAQLEDRWYQDMTALNDHLRHRTR